MLRDEIICLRRIGWVQLDFVGHKEGEEERFGVSNNFDASKTADENTFSRSNSEGNRLDLPEIPKGG